MQIGLIFAIDFSSWTTYLMGGGAAIIAWMVKTVIEQGKSIVAIQTALQYYVERQSRDAAALLDTDNPAPPEIRAMFRAHAHGELSDEDRPKLVAWLRTMVADPEADKGEQSAARQLLTGLTTVKLFKQKKSWWSFGRSETA